MGKIKKYKNIVERFLSNESGQRFFNAAYSLGAAVVILGALFKILHLSGGNEMLCIGMGTEVLMFLLTAFDRPEAQYKWEDVFPVLGTNDPADRPDFSSGSGIVIGNLGGSTGGGNNGSAQTQTAILRQVVVEAHTRREEQTGLRPLARVEVLTILIGEFLHGRVLIAVVGIVR